MAGTYDRPGPYLTLPLAMLLLGAGSAPVVAQDSTVGMPCNGLRVQSVHVVSQRPQFRGMLSWWRKFARSMGLHHETTAPGLVRRFVTLEPGKPCTEFRRSESERILRAMPFLSDATVSTVRSGEAVAVHVATVDEVPVVAGARLSGTSVRALSLGTMNFLGAGVHLEGRWEQQPERRQGFGGKFRHPQLLGRPYALAVEGMRRPLGEYFWTSLSHPFYTDLQRIAWYSGYSVNRDFVQLRQSDRVALLQPVDRSMWNVGGVVRIGPPRRLALLGGMVIGERVAPRHEFLLVDTASPRLDPVAPPAGVRQYDTYDAVHLAGVLGLRALRFERMARLDALVAEQDVGTGLQVGTAFGVKPTLDNPFDGAFLSADAYAGTVRGSHFVATRVEAESRLTLPANRYEHIVASGRAAWYWLAGPKWTSELSVEGAGAWSTIFPFQLELGERRDGLQGHARAYEVGGQRLLARLEQRWVGPSFRVDRAAFGAALFTEAGQMWAGDVPFGAATPIRTSVGAAILAAVPARSQRTLRAELAVPVTHGPGARAELRFTIREPARGFWFDPPGIRWARLSALPEQIFTWP